MYWFREEDVLCQHSHINQGQHSDVLLTTQHKRVGLPFYESEKGCEGRLNSNTKHRTCN